METISELRKAAREARDSITDCPPVQLMSIVAFENVKTYGIIND